MGEPKKLRKFPRRKSRIRSSTKQLKALTEPEDYREQPGLFLLPPSLEVKLEALAKLKKQLAAAEIKFREAEAEVLDEIKNLGMNVPSAEFEGDRIIAVYRQAHREVVDWDGVRGELGDQLWAQVLGEPQPERERLAALIRLRRVNPDVVRRYIAEQPSKPWVDVKAKKVIGSQHM